MRWKIIAGCTAVVLCICAGLWLAVQQQETVSGAANLLHIYSDQEDTNPSDSTGGVQPSPPAPQGENIQSSKPSGNPSKPNRGTVNSTPSSTASPSQQESSTSELAATSEEPESSEPETSTAPKATFSIIGSEGGITAPLEEGDTVYSVTEKMMEGYPLPDFDYGEQGLWEYSVNGELSDVPASEYVVQNGDVLEWHPVLPPAATTAPVTELEPSETSTAAALISSESVPQPSQP